MPKFLVTVRYEQERKITVHAPTDDIAKERAEEIVSQWNNVVSAEAVDAEEL